jgi:hypothetical protein
MNGNGKDAHELQDAILRRRRVVESLHFAAATVKPHRWSRQVPVEKRTSSPYGTHIVGGACPFGVTIPCLASCPPLFLWQREGFQEHAVALNLLMDEVVGRGWQDRSLESKEIGYGQQ